MPTPIRAYLDFASPYSYFALEPLARLTERHGRALELRPILLWAVLKQRGIANPFETAARRDYFLRDMVRSAAYFGVPFRLPDPLQISAHHAARLWHARTAEQPETGPALAREIFEAFFVLGADIADPAVLAALPSLAGEDPVALRGLIDGPDGRRRLAAGVEEAIAEGVIGVPFVILDDEGFFGADRLPQLAWRLGDAGAGEVFSPRVE